MSKPSTLVVIPARYDSSRFPGKPLAQILGREMILRVNDSLIDCNAQRIVTATDSEEIFETVIKAGFDAVMTSSNHRNGTSRCAEALEILEEQGENYDLLINVQGDEPLIDHVLINQLIESYAQDPYEVATLVNKLKNTDRLFNPNVIKVVCSIEEQGYSDALYFSRSPIPYLRNYPQEEWVKHHHYKEHIGVYAFNTELFIDLMEITQSSLETAESLEQLAWLEHDVIIRVLEAKSNYESMSIDAPEDLIKVEALLNSKDQNS